MRYSFLAQKRIDEVKKNGTRLSAKIVDVRQLKTSLQDMESKTLDLEFNNLRGETVWQTINVNDSKPYEKRFEIGETVYLRVDETLKKSPYFVLEDIRTKVRWQLFIPWIVFLVGILFCYNYVYNLENAGYGWRFLSLDHPLISSAVFLILFSGVIYLFFKYFIFKKLNISKESVILKFKGKKATAKIIQTRQTGTYLNNQPEIEFTFEFKEKAGLVHQATIKKIVLLTELALFCNGMEMKIFYDPENLNNVMFENDINSRMSR